MYNGEREWVLASRDRLYEPLPVKGTFRFLILHSSEHVEKPIVCSLFQHTLSEGFEYTALSYEWGTPAIKPVGLMATEFINSSSPRNRSRRQINLNGKEIKITSNLFDALKHIRAGLETNATSILWVDALCINQEDATEKGHQVAQMSELYEQAMKVICWLGPATKDTYSASIMYAHRSVVQRSYWDRAWIIQEFVLGRRVILLCGQRVFSVDEIQYSGNGDAKFFMLRNLRFKLKGTRTMNYLPLSLLDVLKLLGQSLATDPRDLVYASLGLLSNRESQGIEPDYTLSPCEVFCRALGLILKGSEDRLVAAQGVHNCVHYSTFEDDVDPYVDARKACNGIDGCTSMVWATSWDNT